jgi:hypothetical protein
MPSAGEAIVKRFIANENNKRQHRLIRPSSVRRELRAGQVKQVRVYVMGGGAAESSAFAFWRDLVSSIRSGGRMDTCVYSEGPFSH